MALLIAGVPRRAFYHKAMFFSGLYFWLVDVLWKNRPLTGQASTWYPAPRLMHDELLERRYCMFGDDEKPVNEGTSTEAAAPEAPAPAEEAKSAEGESEAAKA
jgi:hypothetical protein